MSLLRTTTRVRALAAFSLALTATTTLLTGCGNGVQSTAPGAGPVIASPTGATSPPVTSTQPSTSAPATATPSAPSDRCTTAHLQVGVRASRGGAAAGSNYVLLTYRNTGTATCLLKGFPGVSFVGRRNGSQLGAPASRSAAAAPRPVRLAAGRTTTSLLQIANAGNYDPKRCVPATAGGFRVYPPGSTAAVFVAFRTQACQRATAGSPQLVVSPVGTAG